MEQLSKLTLQFNDTILLDHSRVARLKTQLNRDFEASFVETKRSILATTSKIPWWVFILLLVLGWNEFLAIISSPLYLFLFLLTICAIAAIRVLRLETLVSGLWKRSIEFAIANVTEKTKHEKAN